MRFLQNYRLRKKAEATKKSRVREAEIKTDLGVEDKEDLIVVERSNTFKFIVKSVGQVIRLVATLVILALAFIGIVSLVYPAPRTEVFAILTDGMEQISQMLH